MRTYRSGIKLGSLLALLVWSTVSESDAIENRQSRPAQRHLDPSGFP